jgi:hypothetical protein
MHLIQDLFLEGFSYVLQIDMHFICTPMWTKIYSCKKWVLHLRWVTTGPHELATSLAVLGHICNPKDIQPRLDQQNSARLTRQRGHKQPTPNMQCFMGKLYTNAKHALRVSP